MELVNIRRSLYEAIARYKDLINSKMFVDLYTKLRLDYTPRVISAMTQLLLKNKVNPLESLIFVPSNFLAYADITTIDLKKIQWINSDAFCESNLESIILPNTCTQISSNAFYGCSNLTTVHFGPVENIGASAFMTTAIKNVSIDTPEIVIQRSSFANCQYLERVKIDSPRVIIFSTAFMNCPKLKYFEFPKLSKQQALDIRLHKAITNYSGQNILVGCADGQFSLKGE